MRVDIVSDAICPWCFIGKRRFERALAEAAPGAVPGPVEIGWRPFQLNPDIPREGMDRAAYLRAKFGDAPGAGRHDAVIAAGREEGIAFDFAAIKRTPSTLDAHRLIRYAGERDRQDATVEALFRAYFTAGRDIGDPAELAAIAGEAGLDRAAVAAHLAGDADLEAVRAEDAFARQIGINGVPCFIFERKYAISGAQPPEVFRQVFAKIASGAVEAAE
jgi:predicted DsbA family dithiol-disulfide isomerase